MKHTPSENGLARATFFPLADLPACPCRHLPSLFIVPSLITFNRPQSSPAMPGTPPRPPRPSLSVWSPILELSICCASCAFDGHLPHARPSPHPPCRRQVRHRGGKTYATCAGTGLPPQCRNSPQLRGRRRRRATPLPLLPSSWRRAKLGCIPSPTPYQKRC